MGTWPHTQVTPKDFWSAMSELTIGVRISNERALKQELGSREVILAPDEIIKLIKALTDAEKTALIKIARYYAKRTA
jgi:hypothetical protein